MNRKSIIVTTAPCIEAWGNFKRLCEVKNLPYHSLKTKRFPIHFGDYIIHKAPFNQEAV